MPGVNSVAPRVQGGLLDTVLKGVQVANDVYGIKANMAKSDLYNQQAQEQKQGFEDQQSGVYTPKEQVGLGKNYSFVEEGTPNALPIKVRQGPGDEDLQDVYILPRKDKDIRPVSDYVDEQGRHGTAFVDYNNPQGGVLGFLETAKPEKAATPHYQAFNDGSGNPVLIDTTSGNTQALATGPLSKAGKAEDPAKALQKAEKVYTEMSVKMETPRGNKAVQQAQVNQLSAENALALAKRYQGNYDQMPPNDYALFVADLSKISGGGAATQHSQETLAADTFASRWAKFKQTVGDRPTPADLGDFIKGNVQYLNDLQAVSEKTVNAYKNAIWNSYKNQLPEELQQRFMAEHGDLFKNVAPQSPGASQVVQGGGGGQAIAGSSGGGHPDDAQALQWANANIMSPDPDKATMARKILQVNGAK